MSGAPDIVFGTVVPFAPYRGCVSIAAAHFSEMARERCNAVRIDVSEDDLVCRMQEVASVVQMAHASRLKPFIGLCGFAGMLGRGSLPRADADKSPFLHRHPTARKVDGSGLPCSGQVCTRNSEFIEYVCALSCAVGCISNVAGISIVHPNFSMCFCHMCQGVQVEGGASSTFRYKRHMPVLPDDDDEQGGVLHSCASATLHVMQAMLLSFRMAPSLAKSTSATTLFGTTLLKGSQSDAVSQALRVLELSPQPSVMQPAMDVMLDSVPAATHVLLSLPYSVVSHAQLLEASSVTADANEPERKYKVHPQSTLVIDLAPVEGQSAQAAPQEERAVGDGCSWDAIAVVVETGLK